MDVRIWDGTSTADNSTLVIQTSTCKNFVRRMRSAFSNKTKPQIKPADVPFCLLCTNSTSGIAGDECAFKRMRAFSSKDGQIYIGHFIEEVEPRYPQIFATKVTSNGRQALLFSIAKVLLPLLQLELEFIREHSGQLILRKVDPKSREVRDTCRMSIFGKSWFCRFCGQDLCHACFERLGRADNSQGCGSSTKNHGQGSFIPSSRFTEARLNHLINEMTTALKGNQCVLPVRRTVFSSSEIENSLSNSSILRVPASRIRSDEFREFLTRRLPLVITNLNNKLQLTWSPTLLSEDFGLEDCTMEDCEGVEHPVKTNLANFLSLFGSKAQGVIWKVKDWPPKAKLAESHPTLFQDFTDAIPLRDYMRQDSHLNISAHFPKNVGVKPDLGPKIYMALASTSADNYSGTTRLHCDLCDAVNIMVHSEPATGTAKWHIFKASDADKIRKFIEETFHCTSQDAIHGQQFYLGPTHLAQLEELYGVKPFIVYQAVGEAVFIPAGCPHQVCNEADCIKVATDFLTMEALSVCEDLASQFREENLREAWKDDVLQLYSQLYHGWISLQRPLDLNRSAFAQSASSEAIVGGQRPVKRRASPHLQCPHCPSGKKSFFAHGLQAHMKVVHPGLSTNTPTTGNQ